MTRETLHADVAILGSGIIAQAIAREARRVGLRVVMVAQPRKGAATPAAGGMLSPAGEAFESEDSLIEIAQESCRVYPKFVQAVELESGCTVDYKTEGTLMVALTRDHVGQLEQLGVAQESLGLRTSWLAPAALAALEPNLSPRQCGALLAADDHQVNPRKLSAALEIANEKSGVEVISHIGTVEVETTRGHAAGLYLEDHPKIARIAAPWVVVASGAWSSQIQALSDLPLRPVRGQFVRLKGTPLVSHVVRTPDVYIVPREEGLLYLGASSEESAFDSRPIAGHAMELLWHGFRAVPGIFELEMLETNVGFRPALRDNLPAIGKTKTPGLIAALGHYRHGIMLAPITAAGVLEILQTNRVPECLNPFSPRRFEEEHDHEIAG